MRIDKTYHKIAQHYYWPGIYKDVVSYVNNCQTCQQCKLEQKGQIGLMGTHTVDRTWKIVAADLMGELPRSRRGFEHLLIFEDLFSRYIICVPLRTKTGAAVRTAIENVLCANHGTPEKFVSDNGKEFIKPKKARSPTRKHRHTTHRVTQ